MNVPNPNDAANSRDATPQHTAVAMAETKKRSAPPPPTPAEIPQTPAPTKHNRSRGERLLLALGIGVPLLFAFGFFWWQNMNAKPVLVLPPVVLPNPNGYDNYVRAGSLVKEGMAADTSLQRRRFGRLMTIAEREKDLLVPENRAAIAEMRKGFAHDSMQTPTRSFSAPFPQFAKFRSLARVVAATGKLQVDKKEYGTAAITLTDAVQMGVETSRGGNLIALLVSIAVEAIARVNFWPVVDNLSAAEARTIARRLEAIAARRPSFADILTEEKWGGASGLVEMMDKKSLWQIATNWDDYTGTVNDDESSWFRLPDREEMVTMGRLTLTSKREILKNYQVFMDTTIERSWRSHADQKGLPPIPIPSDPLNELIAGVFDQAQFKNFTNRTDGTLLLVAIALRAYRAETGDYPPTLGGLVMRGILKSLPADPFSANSGLIGYRRISANKFVLYSVGPDNKDDRGKPIAKFSITGKKRVYLEGGEGGDWVVGVHLK